MMVPVAPSIPSANCCQVLGGAVWWATVITQTPVAENRTCINAESSISQQAPHQQHSRQVTVTATFSRTGLRSANSVCLEGQNMAWPFQARMGRSPGRMAYPYSFPTHQEPLPDASQCPCQTGDLYLHYPHTKCIPSLGARP